MPGAPPIHITHQEVTTKPSRPPYSCYAALRENRVSFCAALVCIALQINRPHCLTKNVTQTRRCLSRNVTDDQVGRPWRPPSAAGVIRCRNDPHHGGTGRQRCVWQVIALQWAQETPRNGPVTWPMRHPVTKLREATRGWVFFRSMAGGHIAENLLRPYRVPLPRLFIGATTRAFLPIR